MFNVTRQPGGAEPECPLCGSQPARGQAVEVWAEADVSQSKMQRDHADTPAIPADQACGRIVGTAQIRLLVGC